MSQLSPLERLGARIADVEDDIRTEQGAIEAARHKLETRRRRVRRPWLPGALGGVVVAAAAAAVVLYAWPWREPLTYRVMGVETPVVAVNEPIRARGERKAVIEFSDGSTVAVAADSQARVMAVGDHGARVRLEHGEGHVNIVPREDAAWQIHAGAFVVTVTGTRFDVGWQPDDQELRVHMYEGTVRVSGCSVVGGISVAAGQSLEARCLDEQVEASLVSKPRAVASVASREPEAPVSPPDVLPTASAAPVATQEVGPPTMVPDVPRIVSDAGVDASEDAEHTEAETSSWQDLAASGKYREAFAKVIEKGFDEECETASRGDLLVLADVALFAGRPDRAMQSLLAVRKRFEGSSAAATAAFKLGVMAFDGPPPESRRWFVTYLRERPGGIFAREARGRLMEVEAKSGRTEAARRMADDYLKRYPDGPHAPAARRLLGR